MGGHGGQVWPSAARLCRWLKDVVVDGRVLELGCGTGAVGLYAAGCRASQVVLTDGAPEVLDVTRKNLACARASGLIPQSTNVDVQLYRWGEKLPRGASIGWWALISPTTHRYTAN